MPRAIKQLILVAAVLAIAMVFVIQFRPGTEMQASGPTCAVENDGTCIVSYSDYATSLRLTTSSVEGDDVRAHLRAVVVEGLIQRWLLLEDAERLGVAVSDDDVSRFLARGFARVSLPVDDEELLAYNLQLLPPPDGPARAMGVNDPKTGKFDYTRYERWVQRFSGKTLKDFRSYQTDEAIAARMRDVVRSRVRISEEEAFQDFAGRNSKMIVDYVRLERAFYQEAAIDRSSDAVAKWAEENAAEVDEAFAARKESFTPSCRQARHILARIDDTAEDKEAVTKAARAKLEKALERMQRGAKFADVAREVSDDDLTAPFGGDLGCFAQGKLARPNTTKEVEDAVYALAGAGKRTGIIESSFGLHVIQLDAVLEGDEAEKRGRFETARDLMLAKESERMAAEGAKQILAAVKDGKTLQQAIDAHVSEVLERAGKSDTVAARPKVETSSEFNVGGPPFPGVENPGEAARMLFETGEDAAGLPNDVIKLYDGYAVAQVKERKPVAPEEWDEKRHEYMARLREQKQRDALIAYVHDLRMKLIKDVRYHVNLSTEQKAASL